MQCCDDFNLNSFFLSIHIRRRCFAKPFLPFSTSRNLRTPKIFSIYWKLFICCSVVYSFSLSNSLYPKWIHCECGRGLRHFQHYLCMQAHYCFLTCLIGKNDWIYEPHRTAPKRNHNFSRHKWHFGVKMIYGKCPIEICCDCIRIAMTWAIFREGKMHSMPRKRWRCYCFWYDVTSPCRYADVIHNFSGSNWKRAHEIAIPLTLHSSPFGFAFPIFVTHYPQFIVLAAHETKRKIESAICNHK